MSDTPKLDGHAEAFRLTADDASYHQVLQARTHAAAREAAKASASWEAWTEYLIVKYALRGADIITPQGEIQREVALESE